MPVPLLEQEAECACVLAARGVTISVIAASLHVDEAAVARAISPSAMAGRDLNILPDTRVTLVWAAGLTAAHRPELGDAER